MTVLPSCLWCPPSRVSRSVGLDFIEGLNEDHTWNLYTWIVGQVDLAEFTTTRFRHTLVTSATQDHAQALSMPKVEIDPALTPADFEGTANEPLAWYYSAKGLAGSARIIKDQEDRTGGGKILTDWGLMTNTLGVYAMLVGFATECALKGLYLKGGKKLASDDGVLLKIPALGGHDLLRIARAATVVISTAEEKALVWLTAYVRYAGRYPTATRFEEQSKEPTKEFDVKVDEAGEPKVHSSDADNLSISETLLGRLLAELGPASVSTPSP